MDAPVIRDGAVLIEGGTIAAVGAAAARQAAPDAAVHDYGDAVILPGLVNAHCHLELSHLSPPRPAPRFVDWLTSVLGRAGDAATAGASAKAGAAESLRHGVTTVGDITREPAATRAALRDSPLRVVSFGEVLGMAGRKAQLAPRLAAATDSSQASSHVLRGVSPHAPYSTDADGYRRCLAAAREHGLPLTTHLAETPDEAAFLSDHAGPFRELWDRLRAWDGASVPRFAGGPVRYAASLGLLDDPRVSLAHVNCCDDDELALLARGRASVVYCPRTHAYFNHPPHRWRDMLSAGVNVALGTDSRASSPDLDLLDDLRLLQRLAPDVPAQTLWQLATLNAARAIGLGAITGSLSPGKAADIAVFPASSNDPLAELLDNTVPPAWIWASGVTVGSQRRG
jgi:cytosine/adenosine deaminase-related metal-dependent hydrolase